VNDKQWLDTVRERLQALEAEHAKCIEEQARVHKENDRLHSLYLRQLQQMGALRHLLTGEPQGLASWPAPSGESIDPADDYRPL